MTTTDGRQRGLPTAPVYAVDLNEAEEFFQLHAAENPQAPVPSKRFSQALCEYGETGTITHTSSELEFGAKVAWRNANRCIGRLYWRSLTVRDRRHVYQSDIVAAECYEHLKFATNNGRIRSTITIFPPDAPHRSAPRILNDQLIRYAGYLKDPAVVGDPSQADFTRWLQSLGWSGKGSGFDVLPLAISRGGDISLFKLPDDAVLEVPITHPELPWFEDLQLRWHAVPAISNMPLRIGGITYPTVPFNGWYLGTEIACRNFADTDRYNMLPEIARRLGLDVANDRSLWKDRALVEMNRAVLSSFDATGVKIADHHKESELFMAFVEKEKRAGRTPRAEWSWVVPPMSGSTLPIFHDYYEESTALPGFLPPVPWNSAHPTLNQEATTAGCPVHL